MSPATLGQRELSLGLYQVAAAAGGALEQLDQQRTMSGFDSPLQQPAGAIHREGSYLVSNARRVRLDPIHGKLDRRVLREDLG